MTHSLGFGTRDLESFYEHPITNVLELIYYQESHMLFAFVICDDNIKFYNILF